MKNFIPLILVCLLFFQCSKDDTVKEEENTNQETFLFGINLTGNYYINGRSGHLYLSDNDGNIIADGSLLNNQETALSAVFDLNDSYDATLVETITFNGETIYLVETYTDVRPATYSSFTPVDPNPNNDKFSINLTNINLNFPFRVLRYSNILSGGNQGSIDVDGTFSFEEDLIVSPGDFFVSFLNENEGIPRYFWKENIAPNSEFSFDYTELPFLDTIVTTQFPENDQLNATIIGFNSVANQKTHHFIFQENYEDGINVTTAYLPDSEVFDFYNFNSSFRMGTTSYSISKNMETIDAQIEIPDLDFDIQESDISNFRMSTTSIYDYFGARYGFDQSESGTYVRYAVFGKPTAEINFSKSKLFDALFKDIPEFTTQNLSFSSASISRNNSINSYNEFLQTAILLSERNYTIGFLSESISKSE